MFEKCFGSFSIVFVCFTSVCASIRDEETQDENKNKEEKEKSEAGQGSSSWKTEVFVERAFLWRAPGACASALRALPW